MKMSKQTASDILTMIEHTRRDIAYGAGGIFARESGMSEEVDAREVARVERAIEALKALIVLG
jgi:hypothetical protein